MGRRVCHTFKTTQIQLQMEKKTPASTCSKHPANANLPAQDMAGYTKEHISTAPNHQTYLLGVRMCPEEVDWPKSCPSVLSIHIHAHNNGINSRGPAKILLMPDVPARGAVSCMEPKGRGTKWIRQIHPHAHHQHCEQFECTCKYVSDVKLTC